MNANKSQGTQDNFIVHQAGDNRPVGEVMNTVTMYSAVAGTLAVQETMATESFIHVNGVETGILNYLSPNVNLPVASQLSVMNNFWSSFDMTPPQLTPAEKWQVQKNLKMQPGCRVLPVPLLSLADKIALIEGFDDTFSNPSLRHGLSMSSLIDMGPIYNQLMDRPHDVNPKDTIQYDLLYSTQSGLVNGSVYRTYLEQTGQAHEGRDGTLWMFPVVDVTNDTGHQNGTAAELHYMAADTLTSDTLISVQLLHQVIGRPNLVAQVDLTNEGIYRINKNKGTTELMAIVGVHWDPNDSLIVLDRHDPAAISPTYGFRSSLQARNITTH